MGACCQKTQKTKNTIAKNSDLRNELYTRKNDVKLIDGFIRGMSNNTISVIIPQSMNQIIYKYYHSNNFDITDIMNEIEYLEFVIIGDSGIYIFYNVICIY